MPVPTPPSLADGLASLSATYPQLAIPLALAQPLTTLRLARILRCHRSLPALASRLHRTDDKPLRVAYLGGSVTEQKAGWRPRVNS